MPARWRLIAHSENDAIWYADGHAFLPRYASCKGDVTTVHSWVFNGTGQHYGPMSCESLGHAAWLVELSKAFAADPHRPVWVQEIGAPGNVIDSADAPEFCRARLMRLLTVLMCSASRGGALTASPRHSRISRSSSTSLACSMWTGLSPTLARRSETQSPPTGIRLHRHARQRLSSLWMNRATRSCELLKLRALALRGMGELESSG